MAKVVLREGGGKERDSRIKDSDALINNPKSAGNTSSRVYPTSTASAVPQVVYM